MAKQYYNGVLLPEIPKDILKEYHIVWIRKQTSSYDLIASKNLWYVNGNLFMAEPTQKYVWYKFENVEEVTITNG